MLPRRGERGRHLPHARVARRAAMRVDFLQQLGLRLEGRRGDRVLVAVEMPVGARRRRRPACRNSRLLTAETASEARSSAASDKFARMRVAGRFAGHRAQAETLVGADSSRSSAGRCRTSAPRSRCFEIELAVVGAGDRVGHQRLDAIFGAVEQVGQGFGHRDGLSVSGSALSRVSAALQSSVKSAALPSPTHEVDRVSRRSRDGAGATNACNAGWKVAFVSWQSEGLTPEDHNVCTRAPILHRQLARHREPLRLAVRRG